MKHYFVEYKFFNFIALNYIVWRKNNWNNIFWWNNIFFDYTKYL